MQEPVDRFTHRSGASLSTGDAQLHYECLGDPTHPTLLLLHGGLGNLTDFNPVVAPLSQAFHVVGLDTRGHGRSTLGSTPLTYARCEADARQLLQALGVQRFAVLGFSDGGIVGYRLAAALGDRVTALVAVGAQWRLDASDPVYELYRGLTADAWSEMFPDSRPYYESVNPDPDFARLVSCVTAMWTDLGPTGYPGERVRDIVAPTLLVRGDSDPLLSLAEVVALQAVLPGASFCNLPWAGHEVQAQAPERFIDVVGGFLRRPQARAIEG